MLMQRNVTVVEFRLSRKGHWKQGLVLEVLPRKRIRVCEGDNKPRVIFLSQTRARVKPLTRAMTNARRRRANPVDVRALNRTHFNDWIARKGGGNLGTALIKALPLWKKDLDHHDPRVHPHTGIALPN
jgi:hypothetical protein